MIINGDGVTQFECRIKPNFKPDTRLALQWKQMSNGAWYATDRSTTADTYDTTVTLRATEDEINTFLEEVYANRSGTTIPNVLSLSGFSSTEYIFGADFNHSTTVAATVLEISDIEQPAWKVREITVKLRALSPAFSGSPSLPSFDYLDIGYTVGQNYTIDKYDTYNGSYTYLDKSSDVGVFTGTFTFTQAGMSSFRRYAATIRGSSFTINNICGVDYPFGPNRPTYPISVKLLSIEDLGMWGVSHWKCRITLAENI